MMYLTELIDPIHQLDDECQLTFDFETYLAKAEATVATDENTNAFHISGGTGHHKKDFKRGTVVCRHWLRGLCMKGDACEFLHQYDMKKMPECRWGMNCQVPECPFRHIPEEERSDCTFYKQGFCVHGPICRYRHQKLPSEECPDVADFELVIEATDDDGHKKRKTPSQNEFFKIAICKHWENGGSCPFGDECHFAHGREELRDFPRDGGGGQSGGHPEGLSESSAPPPPFSKLPDERPGMSSSYAILHSVNYQNLAQSVLASAWSVTAEMANELREPVVTGHTVFVFFTIPSSGHCQGVGKITGPLVFGEGSDLTQRSLNHDAWVNSFTIEWLYFCELPWSVVSTSLNRDLKSLCTSESSSIQVNEPMNDDKTSEEDRGIESGTRDSHNNPNPIIPSQSTLTLDQGRALMRLLYEQPPLQLHLKSVEDELTLGAEALSVRRREAAERASGRVSSLSLPTWDLGHIPGFVVACNGLTFDEVFGRMLFGLATEAETTASQHIYPGTPLYLLNMTDRHLLGVFQALSVPTRDLEPGAFARSPGVPSPFPIQVRFRVLHDAPALPEVDPDIQRVMANYGSRSSSSSSIHTFRIGPIGLELTQALADIFAKHWALRNQQQQQQQGHPPHHHPHMMMMGPPGPAPLFPHNPKGPPPSNINNNNNPPPGSLLTERMIVGIENDAGFHVSRRIIGPAGSHMKHIVMEAGGKTKVRLRGRGSELRDSDHPTQESSEPLALLITSDSPLTFQKACQLAHALLAKIHDEYRQYLHEPLEDEKQRDRRSDASRRSRSNEHNSSREHHHHHHSRSSRGGDRRSRSRESHHRSSSTRQHHHSRHHDR